MQQNAAAGIAVVDDTIAIVIEAVTRFHRGVIVTIANDRAICTRCRSGRTNTGLSRIARHSAARIAVIDDAIAIVVEAIAYF